MNSPPRTTALSMLRHALPLALLAAGVLSHGVIIQDPSYHQFADQQQWLGVAHGQNVWSNLPFAIAGLLALFGGFSATRELRLSAVVMGLGLMVVAAGSSWYHLAPNDQSLFWDRLPMSVAFAAALTLIATDRVDPRCRFALWPLVLLAAGSVILWQSVGDLRAYALVQFGSLLLMIQCLLFGRSNRLRAKWIWIALVWYAAAKGFEASDVWWWRVSGGLFGGHMLKHLAAGLGAVCLGLAIPVAKRERPPYAL